MNANKIKDIIHLIIFLLSIFIAAIEVLLDIFTITLYSRLMKKLYYPNRQGATSMLGYQLYMYAINKLDDE